jgi:hydroxymethylbilane synthase
MLVAEMLRRVRPGVDFDIVEVATAGDRDRRDFLQQVPAVGFFTGEVEHALAARKADIAVHSLKDLPAASDATLVIAAIPPREEPCDAIVAPSPLKSLADLPSGARVGTCSPRRAAQLLHLRPDLKTVGIRGNIETRLARVEKGDCDAVILAAAGLKRLAPEEFPVAPGQGALAVQTRAESEEIIAMLSEIDDRLTRLTVGAEREVLAALKGGCSVPLGVFSIAAAESLTLSAVLSEPQGRHVVRSSVHGSLAEGIALARQLAQDILESGGREILRSLGRSA